jgi:ankyrin repeat protein
MWGVHVLYPAAEVGNVGLVRYLLNNKVNPSILTDFGWAPLHWAANNGHLECVHLLLEAGADPSPVSDQAKTPLDLVRETQQREIEQVLLEAGAKTAVQIYEERGRKLSWAPYWMPPEDESQKSPTPDINSTIANEQELAVRYKDPEDGKFLKPV